MNDIDKIITLTVGELQQILTAHIAQAEAQRILAAAKPAMDKLQAQISGDLDHPGGNR